MKNYFYLILFLFIMLPAVGQNPQFQWAKKTNAGVGEEVGASIGVDGAGNVYTTGYFNGTVDFDPGAGVFSLTAAGGDDGFLLKLDASGNFIWAKKFGGTGYESAISLAVTGTGDIYYTGGFSGTVDFDPGPSVSNLTAVGGGDIFICKMDAAGNFIWVKQLGGTGGDYVNSLALDNAGNVFTTGAFGAIADFDPGAAVFEMTPVSSSEIFISKLDANGNFVWAKQFSGSDPTAYGFGYSVALDPAGNVFSTGSLGGTIDFDPGAGIAAITATGGDIYVSKLDNNGNFIWAHVLAAATPFDYGYSYAITANSTNVFIAGSFNGTMDFEPGAGSSNLTSVAATDDIFITKLDAGGNFIWVKQFGGADAENVYGITTDGSGNVYTTGYFLTTTDFDPGPGVYNLTSLLGSSDIFISKLDASGNFVWAVPLSGNNLEYANSIAVDASNNVYTTGTFRATVDFDPGAAVSNLSSSGSTDAFIQKMSQTFTLPVALNNFSGTGTNSGNRLEWTTAYERNNAYFILEKSTNGFRFENLATIPGAGNSNQLKQYAYTDQTAYEGISYYRLKQINSDGSFYYSSIVAIGLPKTGNQELVLYPNPATENITLIYPATEKTILQYKIYTSSGILVHSGEKWVQKGENTISCSLGNIATGNYTIIVYCKSKNKILKGSFIKIK
jgi:hypothetical protein